MKKKLLQTALLIIILTLTSSCTKESTEKNYKLVKSEGVDTYRNKNKPSITDLKISVKKVLTIKGDVAAADTTRNFIVPADIGTDSKANLFILDAAQCAIKKFDAKGNFLKSFGARGTGPGEFRGVFDMMVMDDTVYVKYPEIHQMVQFDRDGNYIKNINYTSGGLRIGEILRSVAKDKCVGYVNSTEQKDDVMYFGNNLVIFNNKFEDIANLREYNIKFDPKNIKFFETITKFTSGDNKIFVAENNESTYKVKVFDTSGKHLYSIQKQYMKIEYNDEETRLIGTLPLAVDGQGLKQKKSFKKAINNLYYDKFGRLLVCSSLKRDEKNSGDFIVDVFKDGIFLNTVKIDSLYGEDFVAPFEDQLYFLNDKIYRLNRGKASVRVYDYM